MIEIRTDTEAKILQKLALKGPQSRADLARELGVMRSTVGVPASRFLELGVLHHAETARSQATGESRSFGRPGALLELTPEFCFFIGIDISVSNIHAALCDFQSNIVATVSEPLDPADTGPDQVVAQVLSMVARLDANPDALAGIAVSVPGVVGENDVVLRVPLLGWRNVDLRARLQAHFGDGLRIRTFNDASLFATFRGLIDPSSFASSAVIVWLDAGVGGGLVVDGAPVQGHAGLAGEIGHMIISSRPDGQLRRLEDIAGTRALIRRNAELGGSARSVADLLDERATGSAAAVQALREWSCAMAEGMANLTSVLDPAVMMFAGPAAHLLRHLEAETRQAYLDLLLFGTVPATWQIEEVDGSTLVRCGAVVLRAEMLRSIGGTPQP